MADTYPDFQRAAPPPRSGWTGGRIASVVIGAVLALISLGVLAAGGAALWADQTQRLDGYLSVVTSGLHTDGHALASEPLTIGSGAGSLIGKVRIQATPAGRIKPLFVGIAPASAAAAYLSGARYATITNVLGRRVRYRLHAGNASPADPRGAGIWVAQSAGAGTQTILWPARTGRWEVVVMNADGGAGVTANVVAGATAPTLVGAAAGLLVGGAVLMVVAVVLIVIPVRRAGRAAGGPTPGPAGGGPGGAGPGGGVADWTPPSGAR